MQENFSRVFITGDTHGNMDLHKTRRRCFKIIIGRFHYKISK